MENSSAWKLIHFNKSYSRNRLWAGPHKGPLANHDGDGNEDVAKNKRSNEQKNSSARAFYYCAHFLAVFCKITSEIIKICVSIVPNSIPSFHWNSTPLSYVMLRLTCGTIRDGKHIQSFAKFQLKICMYSFWNRRLPWRCRPNCLRFLL